MKISMPKSPTYEELLESNEKLKKIIGEQQDKLHEKDIEIATTRAFNKECLVREAEANQFIREANEYIQNWAEVVDICDGVIPLDSTANLKVQNNLMKFLRYHTLPQLEELHEVATKKAEKQVSYRNLNKGLKFSISEFAKSIRF